jgi:type IV pilus assembly protein PilC
MSEAMTGSYGDPGADRRTALRRVAQRVRARELDDATRQLATLLRAGIPLLQSLQTLSRSLTPALATVLDQVRRDVEGGSTLERALSRHPRVFDSLYRSLVAAGESGGLLDEMLDRVASYRERAGRLRVVTLASIAAILMSQLGYATQPVGILPFVVLLLVFFAAFNVLEATVPAPSMPGTIGQERTTGELFAIARPSL